MPMDDPSAATPRLTLLTLGRGEGWLGMRAHGKLGPRGDRLSLLRLEGLAADDARWPQWLALGVQPVDPAMLQWRHPALGQDLAPCWTLMQEEFFGDFRADTVPALQAQGWQVQVAPGFAHESLAVDAWHLDIADEQAPQVEGLGLARRQGSWLLSLGIEVAGGERLDLAPLIANLLRRDKRWLDANAIAEMDDEAIVSLRAPGGRRVHALAGPLKAIMAALLDLLGSARLGQAPLRLSAWDATRLALLDEVPEHRWQIHGDAGLRAMARRLLAVGAARSVAEPPGLGLRLRPYQLQGLAWLQYLREQGLGGILADEMGLGKTAQALAHVWLEKLAGRLDRPALVVLPTSLLFNWAQEAARITPGLRVVVLHGPERAALYAQLGEADLVLCTYGLMWRDLRPLSAQPWHLLILDEAQAVKNAHARSARALRRLQVRHRLVLTGTPLENHLGELWAQFDFLMPGFLGDARGFARIWRKPIEVSGEGRRARLLAARVRPFILRRLKNEVAAELPPLTQLVQRVSLQGKQKQLYESVRVGADHMVRRILARQGWSASLISVLDAMLKLRQVCCDPLLLKGVQIPAGIERAKLAWLRERVPDLLAQGRRLLLFSQFTEMLDLVEAEFHALGLPLLKLTGATPAAQRGAIVQRFQAREVPLLLASLKAGGVGLNLTAADTVIHIDPWWNPAVEAQASARAHRIGQDQPVFVHQLVVQGSIEERMLELQQRKRALAEGLLGSDSGEGLAKFSAPELERLLAPLDEAEEAEEADSE